MNNTTHWRVDMLDQHVLRCVLLAGVVGKGGGLSRAVGVSWPQGGVARKHQVVLARDTGWCFLYTESLMGPQVAFC